MALMWLIACLLFLTGVALAAFNITSGDARRSLASPFGPHHHGAP